MHYFRIIIHKLEYDLRMKFVILYYFKNKYD